MTIIAGQRASVTFADRHFDVIVIDPKGINGSQPSLGFGFRMMERHGGLREQTLVDWTTKESVIEGDRNNAIKVLKLPSGRSFRVTEITGLDNNEYFVLEIAEWVAVATDVIKHPGKVRKATANKLVDFLGWFAAKGLYADAYTALKGSYTAKDKRGLDKWLSDRLSGIPVRNQYTDFLQSQGVSGITFGKWTNIVYQGLFGMNADKMKEKWKCQAGKTDIARNYISELEGLKAVAYCESLVVTLWVDGDDLDNVHRMAIAQTRRKFKLNVLAA